MLDLTAIINLQGPPKKTKLIVQTYILLAKKVKFENNFFTSNCSLYTTYRWGMDS